MIHVVAGVLIDAADRVLIAQRPPGKPLAGRWEFPGGKLEQGEGRVAGLARELREELGVTIGLPPRPLIRLTHTYEHGVILLDVFVVRQYEGEPYSLDGQALRWCTRPELEGAELLPADRPIVRALRLPERLERASGAGYRTVRPDDSNGHGRPGLYPYEDETLTGAACERLDQALDAAMAGAQYVSMRTMLSAGDVLGLCRRLTIPVFIRGADLQQAWELGASGVDNSLS